MGFLVDSSVKPVSSLAPMDFFCKRSAKKQHPSVLAPGHLAPPAWPPEAQSPSKWGGSWLQRSGGLELPESWAPGGLQSPGQRRSRGQPWSDSNSPARRASCPLGVGRPKALMSAWGDRVPNAACLSVCLSSTGVFLLLCQLWSHRVSPGVGGREVQWEGGRSSDKCPPGWLEGSLRYLELYSEVMKRGPWNTEGGATGDTGRSGPGKRLVAAVALWRLCPEQTCVVCSEKGGPASGSNRASQWQKFHHKSTVPLRQ